MQKIISSSAKTVAADYDEQRLDNYLARELKGAPRSLIYRLIRTGQVRINSRRARPSSKLHTGDILRIPDNITITAAPRPAPTMSPDILFEDDALLVINKPAGMAVHGGSGVSFGVIESLRETRQPRFLELAHRLDKGTSGALLLAKKSSALRGVQQSWREKRVKKVYHAFVFGVWNKDAAVINLPIKRTTAIGGITAADGRPSLTHTSLLKQYENAALLRADIATGRTHQLRVHLAAVGLPIIGDDKYGDFTANRSLARGCRLLLHAARLCFKHPLTGEKIDIHAPVPDDFIAMQTKLQ
ncbi:MAG: RluA family pseudouridine synthase [Gammaproteobacteria bacterium WSBS_2016_MAG_OTU1]